MNVDFSLSQNIHKAFEKISDWALILGLQKSQTLQDNIIFLDSEYKEYQTALNSLKKTIYNQSSLDTRRPIQIELVDGLIDTFWVACMALIIQRKYVREPVLANALESFHARKPLKIANHFENFKANPQQNEFAYLSFSIFLELESFVKNYSFDSVFNPVLESNNSKFYTEFQTEIPYGTYQQITTFKSKEYYHLRWFENNKVAKFESFGYKNPDFSHLEFY